MSDAAQPSVAGDFCIRSDYVARASPEYDDRHVDDESGLVWQPDVYADVGWIARSTRSARVIDVGCGTGLKLVKAARGLPTIGLDYGPNLDKIDSDDHRSWRWYNIDSGMAAPVTPDEFEQAVVVCADVIEHLVHPEYVMRELQRALSCGATAVVMSTPDRAQNRGTNVLGPPGNPNHVREWTRAEFAAFLAASDVTDAVVRHTRAHDVTGKCTTVEAILTAGPKRLRSLSIGPGVREVGIGVPIHRRLHGSARRIYHGGKRRLGRFARIARARPTQTRDQER
jgi:2-polyprenyl-3-methyl-5-hydroxy-6-metoxy-1,4-benzoquinol methylase